MNSQISSPDLHEQIAQCSTPEQLATVLSEVIDKPLLAAPQSLRSPILLFWQFIDEFLDSPKAIAFLFGHWVANCGLREDDALAILQSLSQPEELSECKSKWELLNKIAYKASIMKQRRRDEAKRIEFQKQFGRQAPAMPSAVDFSPIRERLTAEKAGAN